MNQMKDELTDLTTELLKTMLMVFFKDKQILDSILKEPHKSEFQQIDIFLIKIFGKNYHSVVMELIKSFSKEDLAKESFIFTQILSKDNINNEKNQIKKLEKILIQLGLTCHVEESTKHKITIKINYCPYHKEEYNKNTHFNLNKLCPITLVIIIFIQWVILQNEQKHNPKIHQNDLIIQKCTNATPTNCEMCEIICLIN